MNNFQKLSQKKTFNSYQKRLAKIKSGEFTKPISSEVNKKVSETLTNPESKEIQNNFHEQEILNKWKEKYPSWYKENADKVFSHIDGLECKIRGNVYFLNGKLVNEDKFKENNTENKTYKAILSSEIKTLKDFTGIIDVDLNGKKIQRENLKPEPNGTTITKIPEEKLKDLSPELQEKLKDEVHIDFDSAQEESVKIGMRPIDLEWDILIDFMPGKDKDEKYVNLREFLDLPLAGNRHRGDGSFNYQGSYGDYWSSTAGNDTNARYRSFNLSGGNPGSNYKSFGFSVRCIKD